MSRTGDFTAEYDLVNGVLVGEGTSGKRPRIPRLVPRFEHLAQLPNAPKKNRPGVEVQLRAAALWAATYLASRPIETSGAILITVGSKIENYAAAFVELLDEWDDTPDFFAVPSDKSAYQSLQVALASCEDYFGRDSHEFKLLQRGIVVHHGKLPLSLGRQFVKLIESGTVRICLSTSTLSEGMNLPFETILFPSLRGHAGKGGYSAEEIRNVIGRAGRPGLAREGRALVLVGAGAAFSNHTRQYQELLSSLSAMSEQRRPESAIGKIVSTLRDTWSVVADEGGFDSWIEQITADSLDASGRTSAADALEDLDTVLIAAVAEFHEILGYSDLSADFEERLAALWKNTYEYAIGSDTENFSALLNRATALSRRYNGTRLRQVYRTSMRPRSAERLIGIVDRFAALMREATAYSSWEYPVRIRFIESTIDLLLEVPQFDFKDLLKPRDPTLNELLHWWLGAPLPPIDAKKIGRWYQLASSILSYRFTWAFSSVMLATLGQDPLDPEKIEDRLKAADLPLVMQWLRDMMLIGTHDPIVAALLQRGFVQTRSEAALIASGYYSFVAPQPTETYSRNSIDSWIDSLFEKRSAMAAHHPEAQYIVSTTELNDSRYRVWPSSTPDGTLWRDITGYPVGQSANVTVNHSVWNDYVLDVEAGMISVLPYV